MAVTFDFDNGAPTANQAFFTTTATPPLTNVDVSESVAFTVSPVAISGTATALVSFGNGSNVSEGLYLTDGGTSRVRLQCR